VNVSDDDDGTYQDGADANIMEYRNRTDSKPAPSFKEEAALSNLQYLRINDVCRLLRISKPTLWRLRRRPDFPVPTQLSDRAVGWTKTDIQDWLESRRCR
jgi:predicted DNA-binding transcriptional regulator AlpA